MKWFLYLLVLLLPVNTMAASADVLEKADIANAKAFIEANPLVNDQLDEPGLVNLWQRVEGLHALIKVWEYEQATLKQSGQDELRSWQWQIRKRIWSHLIYAKYSGDDEQVKALVAMIRLHAQFADRYIGDEIRYSSYADVAEYTETNGRFLVNQIKNKYGNSATTQTTENK